MGPASRSRVERVHEVLSTEPIVTDPPHPKALPARSAVQRTGGVRFADVRFGYDRAHPVLDGFELAIEPGSSIALVGATGSGKSTIARLLARFYDVDAGAVELDGIDLRRLRVHDLRSAVGIVFEDTLLFHDTVAANIVFADPDASFERIERAAALAGAADFVHDLPEGYDTLLGERGFSLSGGQRQRIAIARAILADPRVLVLDDATSAVDPSKEHEIRDALATVMAERTTIVIAHRPATIALAERVVLLDRGRVEAAGTAPRAARRERPLRRGPRGVGGDRRRARRRRSSGQTPTRLAMTPTRLRTSGRWSDRVGLRRRRPRGPARSRRDQAGPPPHRHARRGPCAGTMVVSILLIAGSTLYRAGRPHAGPLRRSTTA